MGTGIMNVGGLALNAIPEPSTWGMLAVGAVALLVFSRRKGRAQSNPVTAGPNPGTDADFSDSGFLNEAALSGELRGGGSVWRIAGRPLRLPGQAEHPPCNCGHCAANGGKRAVASVAGRPPRHRRRDALHSAVRPPCKCRRHSKLTTPPIERKHDFS